MASALSSSAWTVVEHVQETRSALEAAGCNIPELEDVASGETAPKRRESRSRSSCACGGMARWASIARAGGWAAEAMGVQGCSTECLVKDLMSRHIFIFILFYL